MSNIDIHLTAIVDPKAELADGVKIGPFTIIGPEVKIGKNTVVENHVTIKGKTRIGEDNIIGPYTSIGLSAQDKEHRDEPTEVIIGDRNDIREYVSIHRGTFGGCGYTKIGSDNQIFDYSHFGHDTELGDHCMIVHTTFGGHVKIGSYVVTGGNSAVHQFCRIGDYAMFGGVTGVYQDIAPYTLCSGDRATLHGLNKVGLRRNGFSKDDIKLINKIYNIFFKEGHTAAVALQKLESEIPAGLILDRFVDFVKSSRRGIIRKS